MNSVDESETNSGVPGESNLDVNSRHICWLETITKADIATVGGKNASLGEMIRNLKDKEIKVPEGFAITADAFRDFLHHNNLEPLIREQLERHESGSAPIGETERKIRIAIVDANFPPDLDEAIANAYRRLCDRSGIEDLDVAVRSSATAEDLPSASFAGQHESFLAVHGVDDLRYSILRCFASLFTERAIAYRERKGFDHMKIALSVCVQRMVRSDKGSAGVIFTIDTESGNPDVIVINAAYGLGETVVKGMITPDEYRVFKPPLEAGWAPIVEKRRGTKESKMIYGDRFGARVRTINTPLNDRLKFVLTDDQILQLAKWARVIEMHYGTPMDIEWAVDGITGETFIVQARPETVQAGKKKSLGVKISRLKAENPKLILEGLAVGNTIAAGTACLLRHVTEGSKLKEGQILVAESTDPDWVPLMKKASGIITDQGGRTSHAAIVSRELGIPAVIGTGTASRMLFKDQELTISCAEGEKGKIYRRILPFEEIEIDLSTLPKTKTKVMLNIASPDAADRWWQLPCDGIGLARMEFIINNTIRIHPMALANFDSLDDSMLRGKIARMTINYPDPVTFFIEELSMGIAHIAASRYPNPVIVRMSDFKTNEYAKLLGGEIFEVAEENPMIGFRGASRYYSDDYRPGFELECQAILRVREHLGFSNVIVMIPFCRTTEEADRVLEIMETQGLKRGENGLEIYVMAEIPSNIILAKQFAERFDGFSIGSNDLTQLILGIDRDSAKLSEIFDEKNPAVTRSIARLIREAHDVGRKVGICGQAASDPEFAEFLIREGIDSISVTPDSLVEVVKRVAAIEQEMAAGSNAGDR